MINWKMMFVWPHHLAHSTIIVFNKNKYTIFFFSHRFLQNKQTTMMSRMRSNEWHAKWMQTNGKWNERADEMQSHTLIINLMKISISLRAVICLFDGKRDFFYSFSVLGPRWHHRSKRVNNKRRIKRGMIESCEKGKRNTRQWHKLPSPSEMLNFAEKFSAVRSLLIHPIL